MTKRKPSQLISGESMLEGLAQNEYGSPEITISQLPGVRLTPNGARGLAALLWELAVKGEKLAEGFEQDVGNKADDLIALASDRAYKLYVESTEPLEVDECIHGHPLDGYFCPDCKIEGTAHLSIAS